MCVDLKVMKGPFNIPPSALLIHACSAEHAAF